MYESWVLIHLMSDWQRAALQGSPDLVVATPGRVAACLRDGIITSDALQQGLSMLVLDEVGWEWGLQGLGFEV